MAVDYSIISPDDAKKEIWKQHPRHPRYFVSNFGRVKSFNAKGKSKGKQSRILKPWITKKGYLQIKLDDTVYNVHTTVLECFIGPRTLEKPCCRHLDGNSLNNKPDNLVWGTYLENSQDIDRHGKRYRPVGELGPGGGKLTSDMVRNIRKRYHLDGETQKSLGLEYGVHQVTVSEIILRKIWSHV